MEALGELAGGAAHEFNNLLQAISGQIQFAQRCLSTDSLANDELALAADLVQQSAGFTRQLLAFSRRPASSVDSVKPNEIVSRVAIMLRSMLKGNVKLNMRLGKRVAPLLTDPNTLQQALLNLCINARDAMPKGGTMIIRTRRGRITSEGHERHPVATPGDYAVMSVTDTGCGMNAEARARIFEPFFTTKAVGKGTGLGLAVAFTVVKEWGGFIDVVSTPGRGSTFAIWLPANYQTPRSAPVKPQTSPHARREGQAMILYAEDNEAARRATTTLLTDRGYRVLAAPDGDEAVRLFDAHSDEIELALLDVLMPGRDGGEVFRHVRERRPDLPTIFCSGYASPTIDRDLLLTSPSTWLIDKPFTADSLLALLDEALVTASDNSLITA
jgi:CheY-like chemotaxis protein